MVGLPQRLLPRTTFVPAGESRLFVRDLGSGHPVIVLHGGPDFDHSYLVPELDGLAEQNRLVFYDQRGRGRSWSGEGPDSVTIDSEVEDLDRVRAWTGSTTVALLGHSWGGLLAMEYAIRHPERVSHLILEDASGMAWDVSHVPLFPKDRDEALRLLRMVHGPNMPIADWIVDAVLNAKDLPQKRVLEAGLFEWLVDTRLPKLTMPVTLIWGANDGLLPLAYAHALQSRIAHATLHVIADAAHIPHRQAPDEFLRIFREAVP